MATSFGALCNDFYVNQKLALKMDLPDDRETILHLCEQVRKAMPDMDRFKRYEGELALESSRREPTYRWLAMRRNSVRTGHVNPESLAEAYKIHRLVLEVAPYHLTISPLDVDYVELLFGFDLECKGNHDEVVAEALLSQSPMGQLLNHDKTWVLDVQPILGLSLSDKGNLQAYFEVKTRRRNRRGNATRYRSEPISIYVTVRQYGPIGELGNLQRIFETLAQHAESLATEKVVPHLLAPIARQITSSSA
jgi:hypothetical protein